MREIKFRDWNKRYKSMELFDSFYEIQKANKTPKELEDLEVMQYVGIKDKNGKEVYEGDIIRKIVEYNQQSYEALYEVVYEDTGFCLKLLNSYAVVNAGIIVSFPYGAFYVIGNIYENPELLKDKKYKK